MDVKKLVLLVGALIVAAVTAMAAKNMFSGSAAPPAAQAAPVVPVGAEVLVATRALPVGTIIDAEALKYQPWPQAIIEPAYFIKGAAPAEGAPGPVDPSMLIGSVVRTEITAGQPITQGALIKPGDRGFLAAALGPGMRAITVAVSATSGVAGFIFPGDRVDLMLTHEVTGGGDGAPLKVTETVLRNVRVLATDNRTASSSGAQPTSTVTLEATPKIAEKIAVAQTIGQLSLSLRSIADNSAELERAIASGDVTIPANADPRAEKKLLIAVASKPIEGGSTYSTGSDVSRFSRSTVPAKPVAPVDPNGVPAAAAAAAPVGPSVKIARGNNVTIVPVGAK